MKNKKLNKFTLTNIKCYGMVLIAFAIMYPLQSAGIISNSISGQLVPICTYIVMAISLNLTVGFLGELSLGHAGFMSIGAFSGVITAASLQNSISFGPVILLISIIVGGIAAGIACLLYTSRLLSIVFIKKEKLSAVSDRLVSDSEVEKYASHWESLGIKKTL